MVEKNSMYFRGHEKTPFLVFGGFGIGGRFLRNRKTQGFVRRRESSIRGMWIGGRPRYGAVRALSQTDDMCLRSRDHLVCAKS